MVGTLREVEERYEIKYSEYQINQSIKAHSLGAFERYCIFVHLPPQSMHITIHKR